MHGVILEYVCGQSVVDRRCAIQKSPVRQRTPQEFSRRKVFQQGARQFVFVQFFWVYLARHTGVMSERFTLQSSERVSTVHATTFGARASSASPALRSHQLQLHRALLRHVNSQVLRVLGRTASSGSSSQSVVHDEIIMNFRCNDVLSQAVFVALDSSEEGFRSVAKDPFGIDLSSEGGFSHKRKMAKVIASWKESRLQSESKANVDAVARAHGEPVSYLPSEWVQILKTFKRRVWSANPRVLPQLSVISKLSKKRSTKAGFLQTRAQVFSLDEEQAQERSKPEHPKQLHWTLEANLT